MNKYQEALNNLKTYIIDYDDEFVADIYLYESYKEEFDLLQKLIDQNKPLTLKECIKEWKKLGYEWIEDEELITLFYKKTGKRIFINIIACEYISFDYDDESEIITFQEHNLLSKTLKALEVNNNE